MNLHNIRRQDCSAIISVSSLSKRYVHNWELVFRRSNAYTELTISLSTSECSQALLHMCYHPCCQGYACIICCHWVHGVHIVKQHPHGEYAINKTLYHDKSWFCWRHCNIVLRSLPFWNISVFKFISNKKTIWIFSFRCKRCKEELYERQFL